MRGWTDKGVDGLIALAPNPMALGVKLLTEHGLPGPRAEEMIYTSLIPYLRKPWTLGQGSITVSDQPSNTTTPGDHVEPGLDALNHALAADEVQHFTLQDGQTLTFRHQADKGVQGVRIHIHVPKGATAALDESYEGVEDAWVSTHITVDLDDGSTLNHIKQITGRGLRTSQIVANCGQGANYTLTSVVAGGGQLRQEVTGVLASESNCDVAALVLGKGDLATDHHMNMFHRGHRATSNQEVRHVLVDGASGSFSGRATVEDSVVGSDIVQGCHSLLLSDDCIARTRPQLLIYADEVKASHGATVGQLSDEKMFYLRSRGLSEQEAKRLLLQGFANHILERLDDETRAYWQTRIDS